MILYIPILNNELIYDDINRTNLLEVFYHAKIQ